MADTVARDIHGLPFLAGLALAVLWLHRDASGRGRTAALAPAHRPRRADLPATADR